MVSCLSFRGLAGPSHAIRRLWLPSTTDTSLCLPTRRSQSEVPLTLPTLGTTITTPSEQHWTSRKDPKIAVEDELPYAFEAGADLDIAGQRRGHGVLVKVERDVA